MKNEDLNFDKDLKKGALLELKKKGYDPQLVLLLKKVMSSYDIDGFEHNLTIARYELQIEKILENEQNSQ